MDITNVFLMKTLKDAKFSDSYDEVKEQVTEYFPFKNCGKKFKLDEHFKKHIENHEKEDAIDCPVKIVSSNINLSVLLSYISE